MPVTYPALSGVLNNCALHALTPEIRADVESLATDEAALPPLFKSGYEILKDQFQAFYFPDRTTPFTWQNFHEVLSCYNAFDIQIVMGPVLRRALGVNIATNTSLDEDTRQIFIKALADLQEHGRYGSLSPDELHGFLAASLGLKIISHGNTVPRRMYLEDQDNIFEGRPRIHLYHQGGIDGASSGGHWERTEVPTRIIDFAQRGNTRLNVVAGLFRHDAPEITAVALNMLGVYVGITEQFCTQNAIGTDEAREEAEKTVQELLQEFNLSVAQFEKFLYSRLWVPRETALQLLGPHVTELAKQYINQIPDPEGMEYNPDLKALLQRYDASSEDFGAPTKARFSDQLYRIALSLLTPPTCQSVAHEHKAKELWALRGNEVSALQLITNDYAQHIVFDEGFSPHLYAVCNKEEVAEELSAEFLTLLQSDPRFEERASAVLKERVVLLNRMLEEEELQVSSKKDEGTPLRFSKIHNSVDMEETPVPVGADEHNFLSKERERRLSIRCQVTPSFSLHTPYSSPAHQKRSHIEFGMVSPRYLFPDFPTALSRNEKGHPARRTLVGQVHRSHSVRANLSKSLPFVHNAPEVMQPSIPPANAYFWLRAMQCFLALGGICAIVALLTCPPVAAAYGITTLFGVAATEIAVTATCIAGASALLAASMFVAHKLNDAPRPPEVSQQMRPNG